MLHYCYYYYFDGLWVRVGGGGEGLSSMPLLQEITKLCRNKAVMLYHDFMLPRGPKLNRDV